jgi:UDP-hydrolysing UDP-N-acetyl-D-glucosamine 2-epimerase
MSKRKVCVVVTARASYARFRTALTALSRHPHVELQLVVAASALLNRYGDLLKVIQSDGLGLSSRVQMLVEGETPVAAAKTAGLGIIELASTFDNLRPEVVVTIADRYETICASVAAAYTNIPLAHIQGGEVTGSIDEKVRHANTKLADLHLVANKAARERVIRMGEDPEKVYVTGCPSIDLAAEVAKSPALDFDPFEKYGGVGTLDRLPAEYLVVLQHPVATVPHEGRRQMNETLAAVHASGIPALVFWPNADAGADAVSTSIRAFRENTPGYRMRFFKNMEPEDFLRLLINARAIVGNSSVGVRECAFLGVPAVNVGDRQNGRARGRNVIDVGYRSEDIRRAIGLTEGKPRVCDEIYGNGRAGQNIAEILATAELSHEKRILY